MLYNFRDVIYIVFDVDGIFSSIIVRDRMGGGWLEGDVGRLVLFWESRLNLCLLVFLF